MKKNKNGIQGQTIYRPKMMSDPSVEKEMPGTNSSHHEKYLDHYPNLFGLGIR